MPLKKRLRSLDEFEKLPWHERKGSALFSHSMIFGLFAAITIGAIIGLNL